MGARENNFEGVGKYNEQGNWRANTAFFLGLLSFVPVFGAVLGAMAVAFGINGLRFAHGHSGAGGSSRAWAGLILGSFAMIIYTVITAGFFFFARESVYRYIQQERLPHFETNAYPTKGED